MYVCICIHLVENIAVCTWQMSRPTIIVTNKRFCAHVVSIKNYHTLSVGIHTYKHTHIHTYINIREPFELLCYNI